ncbi:MAG: peptidase M16 [Bacteroidetes bacterium GWC2_33_15]|nr:MAG: peptidase M16 [Bacteroidetes bacterium GWA2_33_15]OFX50838.1 MAG: peptidase M16 [Bacteroidetes bacterium GWC2_33_15]OFX62879.1 MAG: peptidase M16 [Bacteroidetes bacterium GWB2_32_14]OFX69949.1 MAG: peptidase M16 [Bacteroidetes bacterium GWD2_33_33]HAN18941.1 peptidase M16 [Bacteroidales bacterium]
MSLKKLLVTATLIVVTLLTFAQADKIDFTEYDMDNGLHVILHQDNSFPLVVVTITYHVGSKNESPERTGFAHFFEHLMFEGSENIERGNFSKIVDNAGGELNANTTWDRTYFYEVLSSNQLELGLWLESERMLHLKVDSIGVATQKKVVTEEIKQREENQPYMSFQREISKRAFLEHPYKWTVLGSAEQIMAATESDYKEFYKNFYVPNNAVITIAGDINFIETKALINKYFGDIPKSKKEVFRPSQIEPIKNKEIRDTIYDNIQLPAVFQAYHTPKNGTKDFYAVDMLAKLLSGGKSSRFNKVLVDEKQLALQAFSFPFPYEDAGLTYAFALPNMGVDLKDLENAMDAEIEKVQNELISDDEFQKLKNQYEADHVNGNATLESRAYNLAINYTFHKNADLINTQINNYLSVTKEDLMRVAKEYFRKDNRVVLYYLPKNQQN